MSSARCLGKRKVPLAGIAVALAVALLGLAQPHEARAAANPCAPKSPCAAKTPCAPSNPCAAKNPCNPCGGGASAQKAEGVMLVGQVTGYQGEFLNIRTPDGRALKVHVDKATQAHEGAKSISPMSLKAGQAVNISTQAKGNYYKANFIYALGSGGGNPCAGNPCAAKNPCGGNPCAPRNPCAK